jgi:uncharacterized protein YkwD/LysM repeat protein
MHWRRFPSLGATILVVAALVNSTLPSRAESAKAPIFAGSPYDLVNAVNALRASFGLAPYSISPILMSTAQAQADFLASTGSMTHSGPGGIGLTARLLAAGYPLAGDLSLGGFRAENITGGEESMSAEAAIDQWTGDALHLNTMASPNLTEIGAGVAINNGRVYYVIDAARPTSAGDPPLVVTSVAGGSPIPQNVSPEMIVPVAVSTPNADGHVFHDVKFGQTLWQIAITYEVRIDDIKRLNNLVSHNIYPGSSLLIRQGTLVSTRSPTEAAPPAFTSTWPAISTSTSQDLTLTPTMGAAAPPTGANSATLINVMLGIIVLSLIGGIFAWLGSSRKK